MGCPLSRLAACALVASWCAGGAVALSAGGAATGGGKLAAFREVVTERYACKMMDPEKALDLATVRACLELAQRAPTSFNTQPWVAVVVSSADARHKLEAAMMDANGPRVASAPVSVVFAADLEAASLVAPTAPAFIKPALEVMMGQAGSVQAWSLKQGGIAAGFFLLAAQASGFNTCPMEGFRTTEAVAGALELPARYQPFLVVACGYEAGPRAKISNRRPFDDVIFTDTFGGPTLPEA